MSLDDVIQLVILLLVMGGGLIAQMFQAKKRTARRAARKPPHRGGIGPAPAPGSKGPAPAPPGEDEIARRVRELLERASGRKAPPPAEKPPAPKVEPPSHQAWGTLPPSTFEGEKRMDAGFQREGAEMGGSFRVFPPSGISEGPGRGGKKRAKKARRKEPAGGTKKGRGTGPSWMVGPGGRLDPAALAAFLKAHPEWAILGYEILGPPPALREKPPSWEW